MNDWELFSRASSWMDGCPFCYPTWQD